MAAGCCGRRENGVEMAQQFEAALKLVKQRLKPTPGVASKAMVMLVSFSP
jgi:hypothetical protein